MEWESVCRIGFNGLKRGIYGMVMGLQKWFSGMVKKKGNLLELDVN